MCTDVERGGYKTQHINEFSHATAPSHATTSVCADLRPFHIVVNACNATGRLPLNTRDCEALRIANPEVVFLSGQPLSFVVPRTGNYTVTVAGAPGGEGACSRTAGRGVTVKIEHVFLKKGNFIGLQIGQKGTSACDTNPTHPVCQLDVSAEGFEDQCQDVLRNTTQSEWWLLDGGGGGGGKTVLGHLNEALVNRFSIVAAGGGGAAAIPNNSGISPDGLYFESPVENSANGMHFGNPGISAGAGGGGASFTFRPLPGQLPVDGNQPSPAGTFSGGGTDCLGNASSSFPVTVGGFGGGGGGCGNGGGGGGWIGGDVVIGGNTFPGKGGTSLVFLSNMETTFSFHEDGNGFAEFFFEGCSCTFECVPDFEQRLFSCLCPNETQLAQDGLDCIRGMEWELWCMYIVCCATCKLINDLFGYPLLDEVFPVVSEQSNALDREQLVINSDLYELDETVLVYSMSVVFQARSGSAVLRSEPDPLSMSCVILLVFEGTAVVASEIVRV